MMRKLFLVVAMLVAFTVPSFTPNTLEASPKDDFISLDLADVPLNLRGAFRRAEQFWESRITGYSNSIPTELRLQLPGTLQIDASVVPLAANILGGAAITGSATAFTDDSNRNSTITRQYTLPTSADMVFNTAFATPGLLFEGTVLHEMGHALGFGGLWTQNGIIGTPATSRQGLTATRNGAIQYVGEFGLRGFREESGHFRANYVPTENDGGPGTAFVHWADDNWFFDPRFGNREEVLIGASAGTRQVFVSEATWGSLADLGWAVEGFNEGSFTGTTSTFPLDQPGIPFFPKSSYNPVVLNRTLSVPEPSSIAVIGLLFIGMTVRRKRS